MQGKRYWEIDFFRGVAIIAMVFFHFLFDLNFFKAYNFDLFSGIFWLIGRFSGFSFLILVGLSLTISYSKSKKSLLGKELFFKYFFRGTRVFSLGLLITMLTLLFVPQGTIVFGILHLIGSSIILAFPFLEKKYFSLFFGAIVFSLGLFLQQFSFSFPWLLWLGFYPAGFYTFDYYPLLPWFGVVLFGVFLGNMLYPQAKPIFLPPDFSKAFPISFLSLLGRHSLLLYFLHQLILIPIVLIFF